MSEEQKPIWRESLEWYIGQTLSPGDKLHHLLSAAVRECLEYVDELEKRLEVIR